MTKEAVNNAKALYSLSVGYEKIREAEKFYASFPVLKKVLSNPTVDVKSKYNIIDKVFDKAGFDGILKKFFKVLCKNGIINQAEDIFKAYYNIWDEEHNIIKAEAVFYKEPTEKEFDHIKNVLEQKYPESKIIIDKKTDKSLLGGYILNVKNNVTDRSYKGYLNQLGKKLTGGGLLGKH